MSHEPQYTWNKNNNKGYNDIVGIYAVLMINKERKNMPVHVVQMYTITSSWIQERFQKKEDKSAKIKEIDDVNFVRKPKEINI